MTTHQGDIIRHIILRHILVCIEHWQADVAAGLKPTPESLERARALIERTIAPRNRPSLDRAYDIPHSEGGGR